MKKIIKSLLLLSIISFLNIKSTDSSFLTDLAQQFKVELLKLTNSSTAPTAPVVVSVPQPTAAPSGSVLRVPSNDDITQAFKASYDFVKNSASSAANSLKSATENKEIATGALLLAAYQSGILNRALNLIPFFQYEKMRDYPTAVPGEYLIYVTFTDENGNGFDFKSEFKKNAMTNSAATIYKSNTIEEENSTNFFTAINKETINRRDIIEKILEKYLNTISANTLSGNLTIQVGLTLQGNWINRTTRRWLKPITIKMPELNMNEISVLGKDLYISYIKDMTSSKTTINDLNHIDKTLLAIFYEQNPIYHVKTIEPQGRLNFLYQPSVKFSGSTLDEVSNFIKTQFKESNKDTFNIELEFIPQSESQPDNSSNQDTEEAIESYKGKILNNQISFFPRGSTYYSYQDTTQITDSNDIENLNYTINITLNDIRNSYQPATEASSKGNDSTTQNKYFIQQQTR